MTETMKAYRFTLDPTADQLKRLAEHAGASRWAFNHALEVKKEAHRRWRLQVDELVTLGVPEKKARREASVRVPFKREIQKVWNRIKSDDRYDGDGYAPWWHTVSTYAFQSAFDDADRAWKNWIDSLTGKRAGRKMGYPKRKRKYRSRDSFRIHHDVKKPTIRPDGYRRLTIPRLGSLRVHDSAKRLVRAIARGAVVQSVTIARGGDRWYASVLVKTPTIEAAPTRSQREAGTVGVDLGVKCAAALSTGEIVENPRHLASADRRLKRAQRALSRTEKGSNRRKKAARRVGRIHHEVAKKRSGFLHGLTKRLATEWETVAIEDLNVAGMTSSARGTVEKPGRKVRQKAGLNRAILDVSFGEFRRQLQYKTSWYGSQLAVCDRWFPSSKTCSSCGAVKTKLSLDERVFRCQCGVELDRDVNAARNIAAVAVPVKD